ncbi:hypothetical protein [Deinococcus ficus]|uniref:hypothetical protein n=1 Tax=Deinococcus ficus TaxID=317577 RepID=UPI000418D2EB|nr:hypothetical protein [Deinococcus ficus]
MPAPAPSDPPPAGGLHDALNASVQAAETLTAPWTAAERAGAAAIALHLGRPRLAARWTTDPLLRAAALLRLGEPEEALQALEDQPDSARRSVLQARALTQQGAQDCAASRTEEARRQAIHEGDSPALAACAVLRGEARLSDPRAALRALAEGLKVAELGGTSPDAHVLAVLALAQHPLGPGKAAATAQKALDLSAPRSPARVLALHALNRPDEAHREAQAGELHPSWWACLPTRPSSGR